MRSSLTVFSLCVIFSSACAPPPTHPEPHRIRHQGLGEPIGSFPNWNERALHLLTNRARSAPAHTLATCVQNNTCADHTCYSPSPPLTYAYNLNRVARFHVDNLEQSNTGLQHDSPCTLVDNIADLYTPGPCDGSPSCACEGGTATCTNGSCTSTFDRFRLFTSSRSGGENIATGGDPERIFNLWLLEPDSSPDCGFRLTNGHRYNILNPGYRSVGHGSNPRYNAQAFSNGAPSPAIPSAIHFPEQPNPGQSTRIWASYFNPQSTQPTRASVVINGTCHTMTLESGTPTLGTYAFEGPLPEECTEYYILFEDDRGQHRYPDSGSLHIQSTGDCETLYVPTQEPADCISDPVEPDVGLPDADAEDADREDADREDATHGEDVSLPEDALSGDAVAPDVHSEDTSPVQDTTSTQEDASFGDDASQEDAHSVEDGFGDGATGGMSSTSGTPPTGVVEGGCAQVVAYRSGSWWGGMWMLGLLMGLRVRRRL